MRRALARLEVIVALAVVTGLVLATPRASTAPEYLDIDFDRLSWTDDAATAPVGGERTRLTLHRDLHETAERLLARAAPVAGAAIMVDAWTGDVLVWAERRRSKNVSVLTRATPPAASVFKIVTTAALYERSRVTPKLEVCTQGGMRRITRKHLEAPRQGKAMCEPFMNVLGHSRNAAYAQLATQHLLHDDLVETAERIGFNGHVPFDLKALVGTVEVPYNDLEFARTAAGFERSTLSPVGAAHLALSIASGGMSVRMHLTRPESGPHERDFDRRVMDANTAWRLTRMMEVTVHSGTALEAFEDEHENAYLPQIRVAAKTGTLKPSKTEPTTTWFTAFAPSRKPRIVVSVLLQNGSVWRRTAKEVGRDLLRAYFANRGFRRVRHPREDW